MNKKVAIIGSGYTGMVAAKALLENDNEVTLYEKDTRPGGIAQSIHIDEFNIEKHYRHIFKSDKYVIDLIKELNLEKELKWPKAKMGYYINNKKYIFGQPLTLLTFKPFTFTEKLKFGLSYLKIKSIKDYKEIENITAEDWIINNGGESIYHKIWEPLLISKFGNEKSKISMAWLWGKINLRSSSSGILRENLGYMDGSFEVLTNALEKYLLAKGVTFNYNHEVRKVEKCEDKWYIDGNKEDKYDAVLSTVSYPITEMLYNKYLTSEEKQKMHKVKYTAARTMMLIMNKPLTDYYWLNIGGNMNIPFGGVIEHTNMVSSEKYNGKHIIYISNYMYQNDRLFNLSKQELLKEYVTSLNKISDREFKIDDVIEYEVYDELYAQPIIENGYSEYILPLKLNEEGLYLATMPQIYPEDRGMNYAIKIGYEVANKIGYINNAGGVITERIRFYRFKETLTIVIIKIIIKYGEIICGFYMEYQF